MMRFIFFVSLISITAFGQGTTPTFQVKTIPDLIATPIPLINNRLTALVTGRLSENDGGGGVFFYQTNSTAAIDTGITFKPASANGRWIRQYSGPVDVRWFGMMGLTDDGAAFTNALSFVASKGGGPIQLAPKTRYDVSSLGTTVGNGSLYQAAFDFTNCVGVTIEGNGSTLYTGGATNFGEFLRFTGCLNPTVRNLLFESGISGVHNDRGFAWLVFRQGSQNYLVQNVAALGGRAAVNSQGAIYTDGGNDSNRARGVTVLGLATTNTYYGILEQGAGDDFFGRGIVTRNTGRAFYGSNIRNVDAIIDGQMGGPGFSDVLLNVYASTNWQSTMENVKIVYNTTGMYPGSPDEVSHAALVQLAAVTYASNDVQAATIRNIDIEINATNTPVSRMQGLFAIVKQLPGPNGDADPLPRGHVLSDIRVHGNGYGMNNCLLFPIQITAWANDDWTGDNVSDITIGPLNLYNNYNGISVLAIGAGFASNRTALTLDRVVSDGYVAVITNKSPNLGVIFKDCQFTNLNSHLDSLRYINGATATGAVAQLQTTLGGLGIGGRVRVNGAEDVAGNFQAFNQSFVMASSGSDTNLGNITYLLNDGTNGYVQTSRFGVGNQTPLYVGVNGSATGLLINTNGQVTAQQGFTNNGFMQVNIGPIALSQNKSNSLLLVNDGTNAYLETFPLIGGQMQPINLVTYPTLSSGGMRVETNGTVTLQGNANGLGTINANNGFLYGTNAGNGHYLRGDGITFKDHVLSASDINGNLLIANFNGGTGANASTYWRGDGQWVTNSGTGTNGGTVTSVAMTVPPFLSVAGSPVTGAGTLAVSLSGTKLPLANEASPTGDGFSHVASGAWDPAARNPVLASADFSNQGTTSTLLHGNAAGNPSFGSVNLANEVAGNLDVSHLNSGTGAGTGTFWRGDNTWASPVTTGAIFTNLYPTKTVSGDYVLLDTDYIVIFNASAGPICTVPSAVGRKGRTYIVKSDTLVPAAILTPAVGGQTIELGATLPQTHQNESDTIVSDGANWKVIAQYLGP